MKKVYITANQLLEDSYRLALDIVESGYRPTFLLAVWRGGTPIGIAVQEVLELCGIRVNHIAIRTSSYTGVDSRSRQVNVHGLSYAIETLRQNDRLLIVDDVHDSGHSVDALINQLSVRCGADMPGDIRLATPYFKPKRSEVVRVPDFYLHEVDDWLVFPHELLGLNEDEIQRDKPGLGNLRDRLLALRV